MIGRRGLNRLAAALAGNALAQSVRVRCAAAAPLTKGGAFDISQTVQRMTIGAHVYAPLVGVTWRSDSKRFAVSAQQDSAVYDLATGGKVITLPRGEPVADRSLYFVPNTNIIAMAGPVYGRPRIARTAMTLLDGSTGAVIREVDGTIDYSTSDRRFVPPDCNAPIPGAAFDVERGVMLTLPTAGLSGVQVFDTHSWSVKIIPLTNYFRGTVCAFSPASNDLAVSLLGKTTVFDRRNGRVVKLLGAPVPLRPLTFEESVRLYPCHALAYSPDGSLLIVGGPIGGSIDVARHGLAYRTSDYSIAAILGQGMEYCGGMAFHPREDLLALGGGDEVRVYQTPHFTEVGRKSVPIGEIDFLSFSPDGRALVVGSASAIVVLTIA